MNNYVGKICPFCKTKFQENDEIVVCSSCDMPHHKECWIENQGCTTFGCMGTIKAVDGTANTVTATEISLDEPRVESNLFCTKCGGQNSADSFFCRKCGNSLNVTSAAPTYQRSNPVQTKPYAYTQQTPTPKPTQDTSYQQKKYYNQDNTYDRQNYNAHSGAIDAYVAAMVGTKREYYIPKFQHMKAQNKKCSWNWAAFFFTPYWFMYRKMYGYGFANLAVVFLFNLINVPFLSLLLLGGYIIIGIFANYIYMQRVEKNANQAKRMREPFRTRFIKRKRGVSSAALILTIVVCIVFMGLISAM